MFAATMLVPPLYVRDLIAQVTGAVAAETAPAGAIAVGAGVAAGAAEAGAGTVAAADGAATAAAAEAASPAGSLALIGVTLAGVFALRGLCRYLYGVSSHVAAYALLCDLLGRVYAHLQQLPHRFFDHQRTGSLIARSVSDVEEIEDFVAHGIPELVQAFAIPLAMSVVLITIDPRLTLVVLLPLPLAGGAIYLLTRRSRQVWRRVRQRFSEVVALVEDSLLGMSEIKSFNRERQQARRVAALSGNYRDAMIRATGRSLLPMGVVEMAGGLGIVLAVVYGGAAALQGTLAVGDLYVFVAYLTFIYQPFLKLADIGEVLHRALASYRRIDDLLAIEPEIVSPPNALAPAALAGSVEFDAVSFAYQPGVPVLEEISFALEPGEVVGLVGPTGAGKTTVTRLVPRFYDPQAGRVLVGGHDVRTLDLGVLRRQVAIVSQEVFLFHGTVRDNILFGRPDAAAGEVEAAARAANAEEFIRDLPGGYDAVVGDRGVRLSGGQRQRVAMARALLKDALILILDEATSSVDVATEELIQEALGRLLRGRTALIIAHRQSTIERTDRRIVLEAGRLVGQGPARAQRAG